MKRYILVLILCLFGTAALMAQDAFVDNMQLDTPYEVRGFGQFEGAFTATKSGPLLVKSVDYNYPQPFADAAHNDAIPFEHHWFNGGQGYVIYVEAGTRYYLYTPMMNLNTAPSAFYLSMDEVARLDYVCNRAEGSDFVLTDGGQLSVVFNQHIDFDYATIACGRMYEALSANVMVNSVSFELKNVLHNWLSSGSCQPGDEILVTFNGLKSHVDPCIVGGTDGNLTLRFRMPALPVQLVSTNFASKVFKSFWEAGSSEGLFSLKFDGPLLEDADQAPVMSICYGSLDDEEVGYYTEDVRGLCQGETLSFDLTGKIRTSATMLGTGHSLDVITLRVVGVRAAGGEYVFSEGQGTLGSFTYDIPFNEISYRFYNEITPGDGNLLGHTDVEVWVNRLETLQFSKAEFCIIAEGSAAPVVKAVAKQKMTIRDEGKLGATILVPIPAEALVEGDVTLSFPDLVTADGKDHSALFTARYHNVVTEGLWSATIADAAVRYDLSGRRCPGGKSAGGVIISAGRKQLAR